MPIHTRQQATDFLLGRINYERTAVVPYGERQMKLDRMRQLLSRLGNPDAGMPIVHIAGTKGKGSTAALVSAVLEAAGYNVGLFSSPHLERLEQRFQVAGVPCSADELVALAERARPVVAAMDAAAEEAGDESLSPTYFELTTALALLLFADRQVDVAVLEVGLGGRLDSTNVCQPTVSVITSISYDHTRQLGKTLEAIAGEKAGIIKPGVPVVCGELAAGPRQVVADIAREHGCRTVFAGTDFSSRYTPPIELDTSDARGQLDFAGSISGQKVELNGLKLRMLGAHQAANAGVAIATALELRHQGWSIPDEAVRQALERLSLPARVEIIRRRPTVVLDVAHNVASAKALVATLRASFKPANKTVVIATSRDKDVPGIVRELAAYFDRFVATEYHDNPRTVKANALGAIIRNQLQTQGRDDAQLQVDVHSDPWAGWRAAHDSAREDDLVCITGSFFIAAELRARLLADAGQSEHSNTQGMLS